MEGGLLEELWDGGFFSVGDNLGFWALWETARVKWRRLVMEMLDCLR